MIKWGIIGLGNIAEEFATCLDTMNISYGVASRNEKKAIDFARKHVHSFAYESYEAILNDPTINVIYIATVTSTHYDIALQALEHQKHVLCEKAFVSEYEQFLTLKKKAIENHVYIAEAMTIFHMPLMKQLRDDILNGTYGKLQYIQANFGSLKEDDPKNRFFDPALYGGSMLDIGTYALSAVFYFLKGNVLEHNAYCIKHPTGVDDKWSISLQTNLDELVNVSLAFRAKMKKMVTLVCDKGYIEIENYPRADKATVYFNTGEIKQIEIGNTKHALQYEIEDMQKAIQENDRKGLYLDITDKSIQCMYELLEKEGIIELYHQA